ncbi:MAG: trypsin-like peptidase domain-containing protein [Dehalococcoidia bacterium]|nr:trypsin-like peptidase domain-containing protein [Dehalococcoidia bacterium]
MKGWVTVLFAGVLVLSIVTNGVLYVRQAALIRGDSARIAGLETGIAITGDRIDNLINDVQTVNGKLSELTGSVSNLQGGIKNAQADIEALAGSVQALEENVTGLSGLVKNVQQAQAGSTGQLADFVRATEKVKPSVVVIEVQALVTIFPGVRVPRQSAGSGWIINSDGIIVTNNHVVADATSIRVILADGRSFPAAAVRTDPATDLAVIKINASNLPAVTLGDSSRLQVGQPVAAIGNALGLGINMTGGWISRLNASVTFSDGSRLYGLIGTDTAINPGNSGGPLVNANGEVIGITNAKLVETAVEGIGYAIKIDNAIATINALIARF